MKLRLSLVLFLLACLSLSACEKLNNRLDQAALLCGDDVRELPDSRFIDPASASTAEPATWQGIGLTDAGFKPLAKSSRGCLVVDKTFQGPLFLRNQTLDLGASLSAGEWPTQSVRKLIPLKAPSGLSRDSLSLSCGASLSNQFAAPYQTSKQASAQLHFYELRYEVLDAAARVILFGTKALDPANDTAALELPRVLADGNYQVRFNLYDVFDDLFASVRPKTLTCPLKLDTTAPRVSGFQESLMQLVDQGIAYQEVSPGQALNFRVEDAAETRIYTCLYASGSEPCSNFSQLTGPLYAPDAGAWIVRYYAEDGAANRTPPADLPPLAVIHRDTMQSIRSLLGLARLKTERGEALLANKHLLEAYSLYYGLQLALEREPLRSEIGLTFSEVTRSQHVISEVIDHSQPLVKFTWLGSGQQKLATLDRQGVFVARDKKGPLLLRLEEVATFAGSPEYEALIIFKDGSFQLGLEGRRNPLPANLRPTEIALEGRDLLLADENRLMRLKILPSSQLSFLWETNLSSAPLEILLSSEEKLALVAAKKDIKSFRLDSGRAVQTSVWDRRCLYSKGILAKGHAWFIALKTDSKAGIESREEFHCELLRWDGKGQATRVPHEKVLNPDDFIHPPADYRFEEVSTLAYSPQHQWLAFGRDVDPSFVVYDLKKDFAIAYSNSGDPEQSLGDISALGFSDDGQYFATSLSTQLQAFVWELGKAPDISNFPWENPLSKLDQQPRVVQNLLIDPELGWLLTTDEGRKLRSYNFLTTLLPRFTSTLPPSAPRLGDSDSLIVQVLADRIQTLDPYGKLLRSYKNPSPELISVFTDGTAKGLLGFDSTGKLWQSGESQEWEQLLSLSPLQCETVLPSRSRTKLLIACRDTAEQDLVLLLEQEPGNRTWKETLRLALASRRLAWNPNESSFSVISSTSASLWDLRGQKLLEERGRSLLSGASYLPFSDDGRRWLTRVDRTLTVWDIATRSRAKPSFDWDQPIEFVSFAGSRSDRLWLTYPSSGRGEAVTEVQDDGKVLRDFGDFPGSLRYIFERQGAPWGFDNEGRVYELREAQEGPAALISIKGGEGELLLGLNQAENFLLTKDNREKLGVLFLDEDPRQLQTLCLWLAPMIAAKTDAGFSSFAQLCQDGADPLPSSP